MNFNEQFVELNLERFNPAQFDRSFTMSDDSSITDVSFQSSETEKGLINELENIGKVVGAIENHLSYKNLNLKSQLTTPKRKFVLDNSPSPNFHKIKSPISENSKKIIMNEPEEVMETQSFGKKSTPRIDRENKEKEAWVAPSPPETKPFATSKRSNEPRHSLVLTLPTLLDISEACEDLDKIKHLAKKNKNPEPELLKKFLDKTKKIMDDIEEYNEPNEYIDDAKIEQGMAQDAIESQRNGNLDTDRMMEALEDFGIKLKELNIKENSFDEKEKDDMKNLDFDSLRNSLKKIKDIPFDKRPKKALKKKTDDGDEVLIVEDKEKMKLNKVLDFLKKFSEELKKSDLEEPKEIAKDADHLRKILKKSTLPKDQLDGLVDVLDAGIEENYGDPEDFGETAGKPEDRDPLENFADFSNLIRGLAHLGDINMAEAKKLARKSKTKKDIDKQKKSLIRQKRLSKHDNPNILSAAYIDPNKRKASIIIKNLAKEILPPVILKPASTTRELEDNTIKVEIVRGDPNGILGPPLNHLSPRSPELESENELPPKSHPSPKMDIHFKAFESPEHKSMFGLLDNIRRLQKEVDNLHNEIDHNKKNGELEKEKKLKYLDLAGGITEGYSECEAVTPEFLRNNINLDTENEYSEYESMFKSTEKGQEASKEEYEVIGKKVPEIPKELNKLRNSCSGLMHKLLRSDFMKPENNLQAKNEIKEVKEDLIDLRETLNGIPKKSILGASALGEAIPERFENIEDSLIKLEKDVKDLSKALNQPPIEEEEDDYGYYEDEEYKIEGIKPNMVISDIITGIDLGKIKNSKKIESITESEVSEEATENIKDTLLEDARKFMNSIEDCENFEDDLKSKFIKTAMGELEMDESQIEIEKDTHEADFNEKKQNLDDNLSKMRTKVFLDQIPEASELGSKLQEEMEEVKGMDQNDDKKKKLKENLEEFIKILEGKEMKEKSFENIEGASAGVAVVELTKRSEDDASMEESPEEEMPKSEDRLLAYKNKILKNLKKLKPMALKIGDKPVAEEMEKLKNEVKDQFIPKLGLLEDLKEFNRNMNNYNRDNLTEGYIDRDEFKKFNHHNNEISDAVDDIIIYKVNALNNEIDLASYNLGKNGDPLGVDLANDPEEVDNELQELSFEPGLVKKVMEDLDNLNNALLDCIQHLKAGFEQKAEDLDQKVEFIPRKEKDGDADVEFVKTQGEEIMTDVKDEELEVQEMLGDLIAIVRDLETFRPKFLAGNGSKVKSETRARIGNDIDKLEKLKMGILDMNEILENGTQNILKNGETILDLNYGQESSDSDRDIEGLEKSRSYIRESTRQDPSHLLGDNEELGFDSSESNYSYKEFSETSSLAKPTKKSILKNIMDMDSSKLAKKTEKEKLEQIKESVVMPEESEEEESEQRRLDAYEEEEEELVPESSQNRLNRYQSGGEIKEEPTQQSEERDDDVSVYTMESVSFYIPEEREEDEHVMKDIARVSKKVKVKKRPKSAMNTERKKKEEQDGALFESFYFLADEEDPTIPETRRPVFKRYLREVQDPEKEGFKQGPMDEYDDDEVIENKVLKPSDEWVEGKKLFKREIERVPKINQVDLAKKAGAPLKYFVSKVGPEGNEEDILYHETEGFLKDYEPNVPSKYQRYALLTDIEPKRSIAVIRVGEKSSKNPILNNLKDESLQSVPLFVQQDGNIRGKPVLRRHDFEKLFAHTNTGLSPHAIMKIQKDPFNELMDKDQLKELMNTLSKKVPVRYYEERGDEVDGLRVIVPKPLKKIMKYNKNFDEEVQKKFEKLDQKEKLPDGVYVAYKPVPVGNGGEIAYKKTDTLELQKEQERKILETEESSVEQNDYKTEPINTDENKQASFYDSRIGRERKSNYFESTGQDHPSNIIKPVFAHYDSMGIDTHLLEDNDLKQNNIEKVNIEPESIDKSSQGKGSHLNHNIPRYPGTKSSQMIPKQPQTSKKSSKISLRSSLKKPSAVLTVEQKPNQYVYQPPKNEKPDESSVIKKSVKILDPKESERSKMTEMTYLTETDASFFGFDDENLFRLKMKKSDNLDDMLTVYDNQIQKKKNMLGHEDDIDKYYDVLFDEISNKGILFDDGYFPPGPSSMVNNTRKTKMPYAHLKWKKLTEIYENPKLLKDFLPNQLFPNDSYPPELTAALYSLCQWQNRIRRLFGTCKINKQNMYMVKLNVKGNWKPIIIDDCIPIKETEYDQPFVMKPYNHREGLALLEDEFSDNLDKRKMIKSKIPEVEIWPQIVAKALAKTFLNYERMLQQGLRHFLRNLTGMPVKVYDNDRIDFPILRSCFKRQHIVIGKCKPEFIDFVKENCDTKDCDYNNLFYWNINHALSLEEGSDWVEVTHNLCQTHEIKDWKASEDLKITEDWRKYRKYKRCDQKSLWLKVENLKKNFEEFTICRYQKNLHDITKSFEVLGDGSFGVELKIKSKTTILLEALQEDKLFCSKDYKYSKLRLFILKEKQEELGIGKQHSLIKASVNGNMSRSTFCEMRLDPGYYKIIVDVESKGEEFSRLYHLIFHATKNDFEIDDIQAKMTGKLLMETLSNLAIQRGSVHALNKERSLRRYVFSSKKLGICIFTFANRSGNCYIVLDKLKIEGDFKISRSLENGKLRVSLPSNSKKFVVFRYDSEKSFGVEVLESSCMVRE